MTEQREGVGSAPSLQTAGFLPTQGASRSGRREQVGRSQRREDGVSG